MVKIMTNEEIANAIKYHRENLDITSQEMADQLKISPSTYTKIEKGIRVVTAAEFVEISKIFDMSMDDIINKLGRRG